MSKLVDWSTKIDDNELQEVVKILEQDGVIVFPTETVFGIGCNAFSEKAIKKLYFVKQRPTNKPFSILLPDVKEIEKIAKINSQIERKIIESFMPGPLTIILEKRESIYNIVTAKKTTVGIRVPNNKIANNLLKACNLPLATSSANISGETNETQIKKIMKDFGQNVDIFINGKAGDLMQASTIVQVIDDKPVILRQGEITIKQINEIIKE